MTGPQPAGPRTVTVRARGHPLLRATHHKTIELLEAADVTARATCVVGVEAGSLTALGGLRGPLEITLRAAGLSDRVHALANPSFAPGPRAVVRRSDVRSPATLAVGADKGAAGLDRGLAAALADPATELLVTVAESATSPEQTALVLLATPAAAGVAAGAERLPAELASLTVAVGIGAGARPAEALARRAGAAAAAGARGLEQAREALRGGAAVLVVTDLERPRPPVAAFLREVIAAGLALRAAAGADPVTAALVAAGLPGSPRAVLGVPPRSRRERERQLRALAALGVAGVWTAPYTALAPVVADVAARWGGVRAALSPASGDVDEPVLLGTAAEVAGEATTTSRAPGVYVAAVGAAAAGEGGVGGLADVPVRDVVAGLLREDVPPRTAAAVLQHATGLPRRRAYALVLEVKAAMAGDGG